MAVISGGRVALPKRYASVHIFMTANRKDHHKDLHEKEIRVFPEIVNKKMHLKFLKTY
jgi:hypothetical protein